VIRRLDARALGVASIVRGLDRAPATVAPEVDRVVDEILRDVRERGDAALLEYTARFDGYACDAGGLAIGELEWTAGGAVDDELAAGLAYAAARIERYHKEVAPRSWRMTDEHGSILGQEVRPLERVGIYVPGGRAAYPSTVLMTAIPARVAGVREIVLVTPPAANGSVSDAVLAAARVAGVTEAYRVGGAQAVAALAFGTKTIRRVDKIVGPGNIYVALAKRKVFGYVGIDMIAGPSEIVVVADAAAQASWVAADLLAQAEHDTLARAVLITDSAALVDAVAEAVTQQLSRLPRRETARHSLADHGALVLARDLEQAVDIANGLAPEHLELQVADPDRLLPAVRHAGAVFLGRYTPEVAGDYVAGPNHVLPTGGTARFSSPLGVEDFVKRSSIIAYTEGGLAAARPHIDALSRAEGLEAHGAAAAIRLARRPGGPIGPG
jgi:histidinol dehydrogenase